MANTRAYEFITGPQTSTAPTTVTPTNDEDIINVGYANSTYALASGIHSLDAQNIGISASVGGNALTIALKQADGSTDPTSANPCKILFRSSTITSGAVLTRSVTSSLSITVPSGATLGHNNGLEGRVHVYALDNSGTVELAVSTRGGIDERELQTTTAIDTSSDSADGFYSTSARTNVPVRYLGMVESTQATAGTWATTPSQVDVRPRSSLTRCPTIRLTSLAGSSADYGSTDTKVVRFSTLSTDAGKGILTYNSSTASANGTIITVNTAGWVLAGFSLTLTTGGMSALSLTSDTSLPTNHCAAERSEGQIYRQASGFHRVSAGTTLKVINQNASNQGSAGGDTALGNCFFEVVYLGDILDR